MITLHVTPEDLAKMRFAYRPLLEIPFSFRVLSNPAFQGGHRRWVEEACRVLYDVEMPYLQALVTTDGCYIPDFLTPTPMTNHANIEDDLETLLATPDYLIRENVQELINVDGDTAIRQYFMVYPRDAIHDLVKELKMYWQRTLAHYWSRMT